MPSGLATYRILVDSLSLHVRLSLSDLQYNHSSALESYICVGTLPHSGHPRPCSIKSFLPSFLSWRHSCEKRYQTLSCFFILQPAENWVGPGNEAMVFFLPYVENVYFPLWFPFSPHSLLPSLLLGLFLPSLSTILPHFLPLPHLPHHFLPLILPSTSVHSPPSPSLIFSSQFKKIQTAYEILSNAEKREMYDRFGMDGVKDDGGPGAGK